MVATTATTGAVVGGKLAVGAVVAGGRPGRGRLQAAREHPPGNHQGDQDDQRATHHDAGGASAWLLHAAPQYRGTEVGWYPVCLAGAAASIQPLPTTRQDVGFTPGRLATGAPTAIQLPSHGAGEAAADLPLRLALATAACTYVPVSAKSQPSSRWISRVMALGEWRGRACIARCSASRLCWLPGGLSLQPTVYVTRRNRPTEGTPASSITNRR
jgi:hypothetical protein